MLFIVVGPSGSGKTTFIKFALERLSNVSVINVDVYSPHDRLYEANLGRSSISLCEFNSNILDNKYSLVNSYNQCKYGYKIPIGYENPEVINFLDYPGEYPECQDLSNYNWCGLLILPPSALILKERLLKSKRSNRIKSAIQEYNECLSDLRNKKITIDEWIIVYTSSTEDLTNGLNKIIEKQKNCS